MSFICFYAIKGKKSLIWWVGLLVSKVRLVYVPNKYMRVHKQSRETWNRKSSHEKYIYEKSQNRNRNWNSLDMFFSNKCIMAYQQYPQIFCGQIQPVLDLEWFRERYLVCPAVDNLKMCLQLLLLLEKDSSFDVVQNTTQGYCFQLGLHN